jgi:hypothetical protein
VMVSSYERPAEDSGSSISHLVDVKDSFIPCDFVSVGVPLLSACPVLIFSYAQIRPELRLQAHWPHK